jgi:hypothetical protein
LVENPHDSSELPSSPDELAVVSLNIDNYGCQFYTDKNKILFYSEIDTGW